MFGSCSRGTQTDRSDIDLLLVLNSIRPDSVYYHIKKDGVTLYE